MKINWSDIPFFKNLALSQLEKIKTYLTPISFPKGKVVIEEGEIGDFMLILVQGQVRVLKNMILKILQ